MVILYGYCITAHRYLLPIPLSKQYKCSPLPENRACTQRNGDVRIDYVFAISINSFYFRFSQKKKLTEKKYEKSGENKVMNVECGYLYVNVASFFQHFFCIGRKIKSNEVNNNFSFLCVCVKAFKLYTWYEIVKHIECITIQFNIIIWKGKMP